MIPENAYWRPLDYRCSWPACHAPAVGVWEYRIDKGPAAGGVHHEPRCAEHKDVHLDEERPPAPVPDEISP